MVMVDANNGSVFLQTIIFVMNQSSFQDTTNYNYYSSEIGKETNVTKCYGVYGCFGLSKPWISDYRPVAYLPKEIEEIEPHYLLFTKKHSKIPLTLDLNDDEVFESSGINPLKPLYVIAHGFLENGGIDWVGELTHELLILEDCSVIVVDWHGGSQPPYTQAVGNIRLVGAMTGHLLSELLDLTGHRLDHVHCIGHSLGAHLCGYVGYTLQKNFNATLGRITGLDPAEPHFGKSQPPVRLDKSAAKYVDVVHTDGSDFLMGGFGMTEPIGHVDYYPNGGSNQPGCDMKTYHDYVLQENSVWHGVRKYLGCNHIRSYEFFIESVNPKCSFSTIACQTFEHFVNGSCFGCGKRSEKCLQFGYHGRKHYDRLVSLNAIAKDQSLVQYFVTGERRPYCRAHYRVTVYVSNSEKSKLHKGEIGQLIVTIHSTSDRKGAKAEPIAMKGRYHEPGGVYTGVVATNEVKQLKAIEANWKYDSNFLNPLTWRILATPRIYISKIVIETLKINETITVCPRGDSPLISGFPQFLLESYCLK